jgi:hypothetical protein
LVTIESCRVSVTDADLTAFLQPRLAKKGVRNLNLTFDDAVVHGTAEYPLNRFGFGDIAVNLTVTLTRFDAESQVAEFVISDFDLREASAGGGFLGKVLGHAVDVAKRVRGHDLIKLGLEFLRGRVSFLDVDAPGLKLRVQMKTLATLLSRWVHNLHPEDVIITPGKLTLVQGTPLKSK